MGHSLRVIPALILASVFSVTAAQGATVTSLVSQAQGYEAQGHERQEFVAQAFRSGDTGFDFAVSGRGALFDVTSNPVGGAGSPLIDLEHLKGALPRLDVTGVMSSERLSPGPGAQLDDKIGNLILQDNQVFQFGRVTPRYRVVYTSVFTEVPARLNAPQGDSGSDGFGDGFGDKAGALDGRIDAEVVLVPLSMSLLFLGTGMGALALIHRRQQH